MGFPKGTLEVRSYLYYKVQALRRHPSSLQMSPPKSLSTSINRYPGTVGWVNVKPRGCCPKASSKHLLYYKIFKHFEWRWPLALAVACDKGNCAGAKVMILFLLFLVLLGNPVVFSVSVGPPLRGLPVDAAVAAMCYN